MNNSAEGRRMTVEIISCSISTKIWDQAGVEIATPGSAARFASVSQTRYRLRYENPILADSYDHQES